MGRPTEYLLKIWSKSVDGKCCFFAIEILAAIFGEKAAIFLGENFLKFTPESKALKETDIS